MDNLNFINRTTIQTAQNISITIDVFEQGSSPVKYIQGATVALSPGSYFGYTNQYGSVILSVPAGTYTVTVTITGYNDFTGTIGVSQTATFSIPVAVITSISISPNILSTGSPSPSTETISCSSNFTATAKDKNGTPVAGATILWTNSNPSAGSISPTSGITNSSGNASTTFSAGLTNIQKTTTITAYIGGISGSSNVTIYPYKSSPCGRLGDVMGTDSNIGCDDAIAIAQYTVQSRTLSPDQIVKANVTGEVNPDGTDKVWIYDTIPITQYELGQITTFPGCNLGKLDFIVKDSAGTAIPGATIYLDTISKGTTDSNGKLRVTNLDVNFNNKSFKASKTGFNDTIGIIVLDVITKVVNIQLLQSILTTISITPSASSIAVGSTQQLNATCKDQNTNTMTCPTLTWTSNNSSVASVSSTGLVTGISAGTANITASYSGVTSNISTITVSAITPVLTSISISPTTLSLNVSSTQQLNAICKDQNTNTMTCPALIWTSSSTSVASVSPTGLITGISAGTTNIAASFSGVVSNISTVTVSAITPVLTSISISPSTVTLTIGGTQQLNATCKDQNTNTMTCPPLTWTSNNSSVASVSSTGLVTGISAGTANITASYSGVTSNISTITVSAITPVLTSISISPTTLSLNVGTTQQLTLSCKDQNNNAMGCPLPTWTNNNTSVTSVSSTGLVTGISVGTANITASAEGITSNISTVTVSTTTPILTTISITPSASSIAVGSTQQLNATCKDQNTNTMTCPPLTWTSNNSSVASVSSTGLVTGISAGTANITASYSGVTSNISTITVSAITPVLTSIDILPPTVTVALGNNQQFIAVAKDQNGIQMYGVSIIWNTTANMLGIISSTGLFVPLSSSGTVTVTATSGTIVGSAIVTLSSAPPVEAGFGTIGIIALAGLAVGAIYMVTRPKIPSKSISNIPTK